jgi:hypothetical protein
VKIAGTLMGKYGGLRAMLEKELERVSTKKSGD